MQQQQIVPPGTNPGPRPIEGGQSTGPARQPIDAPLLKLVANLEGLTLEAVAPNARFYYPGRGVLLRVGEVERSDASTVQRVSELIERGVLPAGSSVGTGVLRPEVAPRLEVPLGGSGGPTHRFIETKLGGDSAPVFLHARRLGARALPDVPLTVVSGVCLFGSDGLSGTTGEGARVSLCNPRDPVSQPLEQIHLRSGLSLYEVEAVNRLTAAISAVAGAGRGREVVLHLPVDEYRNYALAAQLRGFLEADQVELIEGFIELRSAAVARYLAPLLPAGVEVVFARPLAGAADLARTGTFASEGEAARQLAAAAAESSPGLARILARQGAPKTLQELNHFSYMAVYLEHGTIAAGERRHAVAIESPAEEGIASGIERLKLDRGDGGGGAFAMTGLYLHERVLLSQGQEERVTRQVTASAGLLGAAAGIVPPVVSIREQVERSEQLFFAGLYPDEAAIRSLEQLYRRNEGGRS